VLKWTAQAARDRLPTNNGPQRCLLPEDGAMTARCCPPLGNGILWPLSRLMALVDFQLRPDGAAGAVRGFERELAMVSTWPQR